jgi:hypothetical protein
MIKAGKASKASAVAIASRKKQSAGKPRTDTLLSIRSPTQSAGVEKLPVRDDDSGHSKLLNARSGPANGMNAPKSTVFHGIGMDPKKNRHSARRTGNQRVYTVTKFRNLRHMNNARKVARRERSPDASKLKLRSLADWAASAPEDVNLQLPPLPPPTISSAHSRQQAPVNATGQSETGTSSSTQPVQSTSIRYRPITNPDSSASRAAASNSAIRKDMTTHNRMDPYDGQERQLRTVANGRFFYFPGEVLVEFNFGKVHVGDVRIRGLPSWTIGHILRLKVGNKRKMEIGSNDVITPAQWAQLCAGRSNALQTTGIMIGFEDTASTLVEVDLYLQQHSLAALWYHPTEDFMLVFYSSQSSPWMFLERMGGLPFDGSIRVLTRNKMPPTDMLAVANEASKNGTASAAEEEIRRPTTQQRRSRSPPEFAHDDGVFLESPIEDNGGILSSQFNLLTPTAAFENENPILTPRDPLEPATRSPAHGRPPLSSKDMVRDVAPEPRQRSSLEEDTKSMTKDVAEGDPNQFHLHLEPGQAISEAFKTTFGISYKHLTAVPASKHTDRNPAKARFYLVFPSTAQAELECFQIFLRSHTFHTNICSSLEDRGWDAFRNIYKGDDYVGVILVGDLTTLWPRS